jgi:2-iminoacetate synthase ThiH
MKLTSFIRLAAFGLSSIVFRRKKAILGTIIVTDKCNLHCKHCSFNNVTEIIYPYQQIKSEMEMLYKQGIRILFFCGGIRFGVRRQHKSYCRNAADISKIYLIIQ